MAEKQKYKQSEQAPNRGRGRRIEKPQNAGKTLTRDFLVDRIWTDGAEFVEENALSVTIARLRRKLDANDRVQTIYGIGYSWRIKE